MKSRTNDRKMKTTTTFAFLLALSLTPLAARAQTATNAAPALTDEQQIREQLKNLPPDQRAAKVRELREKRREEMMKLSPEERRARLEEMRQQRVKALPAERQIAEQRRANMKARLEALRARKAEGKLSEQEEKLLERMERANKLLEEHSLPPKPAEKTADQPTVKPAEKSEPAKN